MGQERSVVSNNGQFHLIFKASPSVFYVVVSAKPTESFLLFVSSQFRFLGLFVVGRSSVVVCRSLLLMSVQGSVVMEGVGGGPQASELREVRVGLGGRRAAALCSVRKL